MLHLAGQGEQCTSVMMMVVVMMMIDDDDDDGGHAGTQWSDPSPQLGPAESHRPQWTGPTRSLVCRSPHAAKLAVRLNLAGHNSMTLVLSGLS